MKFRLADDLQQQFPADSNDAFDAIMNLDGESVRRVEKRHTFRCEIGGVAVFVKHHYAPMWWEATTDLLRGSNPILGADNEFAISQRLRQLGIRAPEPAGMGVRWQGLARQSFLITRAIDNTEITNHVIDTWNESPPTIRFRFALIRAVAEIARNMHGDGINHRDFYLNHFRLLLEPDYEHSPVLCLMDLHRAQRRRQVPERWLVKDLGALLFSCLDKPLTSHDVLRFLWHYENRSLRTILRKRRFWTRVIRKALRIYERALRKGQITVHNHKTLVDCVPDWLAALEKA